MQPNNCPWLLSLFTAVLAACWTAPAHAENQIDEALAAQLGKEVVEAAHPSARKVSVLEYRETTSDGRLVASMKVRYHGTLTGSRYTATISFTVDPSHPLRVVAFTY